MCLQLTKASKQLQYFVFLCYNIVSLTETRIPGLAQCQPRLFVVGNAESDPDSRGDGARTVGAAREPHPLRGGARRAGRPGRVTHRRQ